MRSNFNKKNDAIVWIALLIAACFFFSCKNEKPEQPTSSILTTNVTKKGFTPPVSKKEPKELNIHGDTRIDNYYWLNDRENPEVIKYLEAENKYKEKMMAHLADYQEEIFEELKGRIKQTDMSVPYKDNGFYYFTRYEEGQEYPIYCRKEGNLEATEQILLNLNKLAKPFDFFNIGGRSISPDNQILAYGEDTLSRRKYTLRFKNLKTGDLYADQIPNTTGGAVWANDNKTIFYNRKDNTLRSFKVFKHILGTDVSKDEEVFHETDETFSCFVYKTRSKKYIVIGSFHTLSNEYRVINADQPNGEWHIIQPRERNLEYNIAHFENQWYVLTNMEAENFRLMVTPENATTKENWKEVIPHRKDVFLQDMTLFKDYLVLEERVEGIRKIRVLPWKGNDFYIGFGETVYLSYVSTNPEFDTDILRIGYQSMTTPNTIYDFNMKSKEKELLKQQQVMGGFDSENYTTKRVYVTARDGIKVPISIVYKKGTPIDGTAPCLLYGYGSYGASMDPSFRSSRLSLLDRGFVYAIAHIRGGQELGRQWYENGKKLKKKNTFTDFIDAGKYLVAEKYADKDNLFAMGGSAGGLLMGAVVNMSPELWKGVVAAVPFVDVVTTMLDESIPLTTGEFDEWGNPKDEEYYHYIKSYSPYDNVEAKDYPTMLVTTGLHDSQVQYWEPAKWVAKLREMKTDKNPLLLHTNMEAGHGGKSGRFQRLQETAMKYAFFLELAGKAKLKG